jgi:hypothetical protein
LSEIATTSAWQLPPIALEIARKASIGPINLLKFDGQLGDLHANDAIDNLSMQFRFGAVRAPEPLHFSTFVGLDLVCFSKADPLREIAKLNCMFAIKYLLNDAMLLAKLSDEDFIVFASTTSLRTLWPYIREFSQSMAQKMMLPPLTLPFLQALNPTAILEQAQRVGQLTLPISPSNTPGSR